MKNFLLIVIAFGALTTSVSALERGDTVYTCHWNQDGFMWLGGRYHACTHIILENWVHDIE